MPNNSIFMRFPRGLAKALTLSYDDGVAEDIRLVEIMKQHGLCGTFNINSGNFSAEGEVCPPEKKWGFRLTKSQTTALYAQDGIEPAVHTLTHAHLESLSPAQATYEVMKDRENLEAQFGRVVRGMAYPYGTYTDETVEVLRSCGIVYCRTIKQTEKFEIPTDWLRLNPTCHHTHPRLPELTRRFVEETPTHTQFPWLFYVWGHAYEFERDQNWQVIENFAEAVGGKDDVWYATNIEIYEYVEAFRALIFSADMTYVQNPTAKDVWFIKDKELFCVAAGEATALKK